MQRVGRPVGVGPRPLGIERCPLAHAEAVLLVDDDDRERGKAHGGLDQRVGADDQRELPAGELAEDVGPAPGRGGAGEQGAGHGLGSHQALQRGEVLLGERLGGRHQRRLAPVLDGAEHGVERDDGLARPHLAHEQALHRAVAGEVAVEHLYGRFLVGREREGERRPPAGAERGRLVEHGSARARAPAGAAAQEYELQEQQLVEGESGTSRLGVRAVAGEVHGRERRAALGQTLGRPHAGREGSTTSASALRAPRTRVRICVELMPSAAG